jgi:hypothetical protein
MTFASYGPEAGAVTDADSVAANLLDFVFARSGASQAVGILLMSVCLAPHLS